MAAPKQNSHYTADDITVLDGLEPVKNPRPLSPQIDLHPEKLHGITQEESDRRCECINHALTMNQCAGLQPSEELLAQARRYISGEISIEGALGEFSDKSRSSENNLGKFASASRFAKGRFRRCSHKNSLRAFCS